MCGIAGIVALRLDRGGLSALGRAARALEHRGPDSHGFLLYPGPGGSAEAAADPAALTLGETIGPAAALASRRLAIIDLSPAGHQPMSTADGRYTLVYNGELYNYLDLRTELAARGHHFRSGTDTEVVLEAWAEWQSAALARFEGMFAFALLDRTSKRLVLARDGFGIKPLFYAGGNGRFVFASEIPALLAFGGIGRGVNPARIYDYLASSNTDHGSETMLAEVRQIPPAHYLEVPLDLASPLEPVRYWRADAGERRAPTLETAATELRELFLDSVRLHLQSDVPVGFALSGGVDSSAVLLAARRVLGGTAALHAFAFVPDDPAISEAGYQDIAATAAAATLHQLQFSATDLARDFDRLMEMQGEPFASPTIYAQYRIFALAQSKGIRVMLGGQGADELFAGYQRYLPARVATLIRQGSWLEAARFVGKAGSAPAVGTRPLARAAVALALPPGALALVRRLRRRASALDWIDYRWFEERGCPPPAAWRPRTSEAMKELMVHTLEQVHLQALMRYEDRNAMALSIENRVPFLTPRLARFAFSLPEALLVSPAGENKSVLRRALRGLVPDPILDRRDKIGFAVPVSSWLRALSPWVEQRLALAACAPVVRVETLRRHWDAVRFRDHIPSAFMLWRYIGLVTWADRFAVDFNTIPGR